MRIFMTLMIMMMGAPAMGVTPTVYQVSKSLVFSTTTILISTTTSAAIPTTGLSLVGIQLPAAFTGTTLTFSVSIDGVLYQPLYTSTSGTALSYTVAQGHYVAINPQDFYGVNYFKIISGSSEVAARTLSITLKGL